MSNRFKTVVSVWMVFSIADSLHHHYDSTLDDSLKVLQVDQESLNERMSLYEDLASPKKETASSTVPYVSTRRSDFEVFPPNNRFVFPLSPDFV